MQHGMFELSVLVDGHPVREFGHQGRTYVEGRKGNAYTLKFRNNSPCRVLVIPSVDGLNTVDGQPATDGSRGYVVAGYSSASIEGWRTSLASVASFLFSDRKGSYSNQQQGTAANCGVIGCKVFAEVVKPVPQPVVIENHHHHHHERLIRDGYPPISPWPSPIFWCGTGTVYGNAGTANSASLCPESNETGMTSSVANFVAAHSQVSTTHTSAVDFNIGTGWGSAKADVVNEASFERALSLGLLEIYYTDAKGLAKVGINVKKESAVSAPLPQSFGGFCQPPK